MKNIIINFLISVWSVVVLFWLIEYTISGDDLLLASLHYNNQSIIGGAIEIWDNWSGRFISFILLQLINYDLKYFIFNSFFDTGLRVLFSLFIIYFICSSLLKISLSGIEKKFNYFHIISIAPVVFFFSFDPESIFRWGPGLISYGLSLAIISLLVYRLINKRVYSYKDNMLIIPLPFILETEYFVALFISILTPIFLNKKSSLSYNFFSFISLVFFYISYNSPGNSLRDTSKEAFLSNHKVSVFFESIYISLYKWIELIYLSNIYLIIVLFFFVSIVYKIKFREHILKYSLFLFLLSIAPIVINTLAKGGSILYELSPRIGAESCILMLVAFSVFFSSIEIVNLNNKYLFLKIAYIFILVSSMHDLFNHYSVSRIINYTTKKQIDEYRISNIKDVYYTEVFSDKNIYHVGFTSIKSQNKIMNSSYSRRWFYTSTVNYLNGQHNENWYGGKNKIKIPMTINNSIEIFKNIDRFYIEKIYSNDSYQKDIKFKEVYRSLKKYIDKKKPIASDVFDIYFHNNVLIYYKKNCMMSDIKESFFIHIHLKNSKNKINDGFDIRRDQIINNNCIIKFDLKDHDVKYIRTGQFYREGSKYINVWDKIIK